MSRESDPTRRWQLSIRDLLLFTLGVSCCLPAIGALVTGSLTGLPRFVAYFVALGVLAGSIGALTWRVCLGSRAEVMDGFCLGSSLAIIALYLFLGLRILF